MQQEVPMQSDLIKWSEEGRLRPVAEGVTRVGEIFTSAGHTVRVNDTIIVNDGVGVEEKGIVTDVAADTFTVKCSKAADWTIADAGLKLFVYSNEYRKGTLGRDESLEAQPDIFENKPIIIKDVDIVNGSDMAQIGWIQVEGDNGAGYLWYLKSRSQTRMRFDDYIEMGMIEGTSFEAGSAAAGAGFTGTEGFFEAVEQGNVFDGEIVDLDDVDEILNRLNKQGAISEYLMFNNFSQDRAIDKLLASQNSLHKLI